MSESHIEDDCVVIDNGSHTIKAGYAANDAPLILFRTVTGAPLHQDKTNDGESKKCYVGDEVINDMDALDIRRPIERGVVTDWDAMERIWDFTFKSLDATPSDKNVLLTDLQMNPKWNREKMAQVMFEKFQPQGMFVFSPNVLSHYANGRVSALLLESGFEVTSVVCIYEGRKIAQSMFRSDIGGNDVTHYLIELLGKRGYSFTTPKEIEEVRTMKETCAFVSLDPEAEKEDKIKKELTCSDGTTICLGNERFQCMEAMFNPTLIGSSACGIHELILKSIEACPIHVRADIYVNLILSGGNTKVAGLADRIDQELRKVLPTRFRKRVIAPPERLYSSWIGGSIVSSLTTTQNLCMRSADYEEFGPNVVYNPGFSVVW
ncbi:actin, cytoplasmic 1-like isoform X2 [Argopecten irradians]|uniref:actin, cytoplasmic 1-like isoform X2 n=1 Tax=Argopecten irradians TaxID=31199 RepID=UPI0037164B8B